MTGPQHPKPAIQHFFVNRCICTTAFPSAASSQRCPDVRGRGHSANFSAIVLERGARRSPSSFPIRACSGATAGYASMTAASCCSPSCAQRQCPTAAAGPQQGHRRRWRLFRWLPGRVVPVRPAAARRDLNRCGCGFNGALALLQLGLRLRPSRRPGPPGASAPSRRDGHVPARPARRPAPLCRAGRGSSRQGTLPNSSRSRRRRPAQCPGRGRCFTRPGMLGG